MAIPTLGRAFHDLEKVKAVKSCKLGEWKAKFTYTFYNHFHPFVGELVEQLNKKSIAGLLDAGFHESLKQDFFNAVYDPNEKDKTVEVRYFPREIEISEDGAYSVYNWELLFHVPLTIAVHLSKNQRFVEAQRWFHYIFDPTARDGQFWRFLAFRDEFLFSVQNEQQIVQELNSYTISQELRNSFSFNDVDLSEDAQVRLVTAGSQWQIADQGSVFSIQLKDGNKLNIYRKRRMKQTDELLYLVSKPENELNDEELKKKRLVLSGYEQLRKNPFNPHVVARTRPLAYALNVVMKYLDNLIAWGDSLFRQDTIETINEATQIYVLAANILGPRAERVPRQRQTNPMTFEQLKSRLDKLGNALVELEGQFPFSIFFPTMKGVDTDQTNSLFGIGRILYFYLPHNDKLLTYWDMVADRLLKIRHCMNIEGVVRQLPLFQPPIDPGMLVKAAAAGIDVSSLFSGLNQPLSPVRAQLLIQKALEIASEVRGMGNSLLAALEKRNAEALGRLRQKHEVTIQQLAQDVRYLQWKEAEASTEALIKSRDIALERYLFYQRLLGKTEEELQGVADFSLEQRELTEENFDEVYSELVEQFAQDVQRAEYPPLEVIDEGRLFLNKNEDEELNVRLPHSLRFQNYASASDALSAALYYIPNFKIDASYWGIGGDTEIAGGQFLGNAGQAISSGLRTWANIHSHKGAVSAKTSSYQRRADEWMLQANLAARELMQIGRQTITSLIREEITRHEYENLKKQIEQAQEIDQFLHDKFTNEELYGWMAGELSKLYYEYYKFAYDIPRGLNR